MTWRLMGLAAAGHNPRYRCVKKGFAFRNTNTKMADLQVDIDPDKERSLQKKYN